MNRELKLCFRLLRCADSIRIDLSRFAAAVNVQLPDLLALRAMVDREMPLHPSELALALQWSRGYVTAITRRLLASGHIAAQAVSYGSRCKTLSVTQSGRTLYAEAMRLLDEEDPLSALAALDRDDRTTLATVLERWMNPFDEPLEVHPVHTVNRFRWRR